MDLHRGFYHRLPSKRQDLGEVLGGAGLTPSSDSASGSTKQASTAAASPQNSSGLGGTLGAVTSIIGEASSLVPSLGPSSATTSSAPLIRSSSSSTGSTTTPASSVQSTTSTSSTSTSAPATQTPTSLSPVSEAVYTSSDGTNVVYLTSTLSNPSATTTPHPSFFQNRPLAGGIFALVGIVALVTIFVIVTYVLRKRRRDRLEMDLAAAVTFDPSATDHYERQEELMEKRRLSMTSSGHSHGYGYGYGARPAYAPQQEYHGPTGYGQYPAAAYSASPPNPVPYRTPSPTAPQPAQGGANLTRKFSDRKPVPPLLPNPAHDPSNPHVSIPPQFYQH